MAGYTKEGGPKKVLHPSWHPQYIISPGKQTENYSAVSLFTCVEEHKGVKLVVMAECIYS